MKPRKSRSSSTPRTPADNATPDLFAEQLAGVVQQAFSHTSHQPSLPTPADSTQLRFPPQAPSSPAAIPPDNFPAELPPADLPDHVIPARMLNEFVYCPRLFYYEHVEGIFVENADTERGKSIHKRVDAGNGALPAANSTTEDTIHSRSVSLGSDRLGVTAKLDLVESTQVDLPGLDPNKCDDPSPATALETCPVDYKVGSPREGDDGLELWPADRMQLGLQILLLRDNGYPCQRGIIYYRGTKQRVPLLMTDTLEAWIVQQIAEARRISQGPIPAPLVASPKCNRCSLNAICLPDETRLLADLANPPPPDATPPFSRSTSTHTTPRRLLTPGNDTRVLYLNTPGYHIGRKNELLVVREEKHIVEEIRINDLTHVSLFGNIQLSTQAVQILCEKEVPITYFSMGGWFYGITRGHEQKNVFTRIEQFRIAADPSACLSLARQFIYGKIRNHRTLLMRLHAAPPAPIVAKLKTLADSALQAESLAELLGTEGAAASFYFQEFNGMLKAEDYIDVDGPPKGPQFRLDFQRRNRRPPTDPVNALLSLAYSLLAKDCTLAAMSVGFDPYVGFYHQPRFGRPALALDLMEEFRPLIAESAVLTCVNNRMIQPEHFVQAGQAVNLTKDGRKIFFNAYEQRMNSLITHPIFDYKVSYRRVLELQFRFLARYLTGEIAEYTPFMTR